jgi:FMN-dependent NADH-azoreductase
MPTLLQIDSSPLPTSLSRELTREFVQAWKAAHPDGTVITRDLTVFAPRPLDAAWIQAAYTPDEARTAEQKGLLAVSEELIGELERADEYVIGVAMHNFSIPAVLKLWVDQVARKGRTFTYGPAGPKGLLLGKKATLLVATGGRYGAGSPAAAMNFADPYLVTVLSFLGVTDIKVITAGGASQLAAGAVDRPTFLQPALEQVRAVAA